MDKQATRGEKERLECWHAFLKRKAQEFGEQTIKRWLFSLEPLPSRGKVLRFQARDPLQIHWFEEQILPSLSRELLDKEGRAIPVQLQLSTKRTQNRKAKKELPALNLEWLTPREEQTFTTFSLNEQNQMPLDLFQKMGQTLEHPFNPVYLYGVKGVGKSHLLNALALAWVGKRRVIFTSGEQFAEHVVIAMRTFDMQRFRAAYRSADCLILDGIEGLCYKTASQEEFFHTFNTLHMAGKPIVLSAGGPPSELKGMEQRLISRFEWGIVLPLNDTEHSTLPILKEIDATKIVQQVAAFFKVTPQDILGRGQRRLFSLPRQFAMFLCRTLLQMSYKKIGRFFGRDHSTVITSIEAIKNGSSDLRMTLKLLTDHL